MRRLIIFLFIMMCEISVNAVTSGQFTINFVPHSGGKIDLESGGIKMMGMHGEVFYKTLSYSGLTIIPGIYGPASAPAPLIIPEVDDGRIYQTIILRTSDDPATGKIKLEWQYRPGSGIAAVDIWRLAGAEKEYSKTDTWTKLNPIPITGTTWTDNINPEVKVGNGINAYYRIVPAGTTLLNIHELVNNARTVGKADLFINKVLGNIPITFPFKIAQNSTINDLIGKQLTAGDYSSADKIVAWDIGGNLQEGWLKNESGGVWQGSLLSLEQGKGYWVVLNPGHDSKTITLVGSIITLPVQVPLSGPPNFANFCGLPYPKSLTPSEAGLSGSLSSGDYAVSDKIQSWDAAGNLLENWFNSATGAWQGNYQFLILGKGYWVSNKNLRNQGQPDIWEFRP